MTDAKKLYGPGPFRAAMLPEGSPYELSGGHAILCAPAGRRHGGANAIGALPLATDPRVTEVGVDVGFELDAGTLRAPDVAVGNVADQPGWGQGAPPLAVEYADRGTDEADLRVKIDELLRSGTQHVWVVRLEGPRRVEVHRPGRAVQVVTVGQVLEAPGVLQNEVAVEALFDRGAALDAALRNLLQRKGYDSLDEVYEEGVDAGVEKGLEQGREQGVLLALAHQVERRLGRVMTTAEQATFKARLDQLGATRVGDVVFDATTSDLEAWLANTEAT